ncbi:MAG TPA: hypothetical protein VKF17_00740 [Isosphaeraceae bacterium]|nr:hypothetical protein [Isosphaeraceae bacterium]
MKANVGAVGPENAGLLDLVFDTDSAQWQGDPGSFLRDKMTDEVKHARVRVHGSGPRRSSPVRLRAAGSTPTWFLTTARSRPRPTSSGWDPGRAGIRVPIAPGW